MSAGARLSSADKGESHPHCHSWQLRPCCGFIGIPHQSAPAYNASLDVLLLPPGLPLRAARLVLAPLGCPSTDTSAAPDGTFCPRQHLCSSRSFTETQPRESPPACQESPTPLLLPPGLLLRAACACPGGWGPLPGPLLCTGRVALRRRGWGAGLTWSSVMRSSWKEGWRITVRPAGSIGRLQAVNLLLELRRSWAEQWRDCPAADTAQYMRWCCRMVFGVVVQLTGGGGDHVTPCRRRYPNKRSGGAADCWAAWLVREAAVMPCLGAALPGCETWRATVCPTQHSCRRLLVRQQKGAGGVATLMYQKTRALPRLAPPWYLVDL